MQVADLKNKTTWHLKASKMHLGFVASAVIEAPIRSTPLKALDHYAPTVEAKGYRRDDDESIDGDFSIRDALSTAIEGQVWQIQGPFTNDYDLNPGVFVTVERWSKTKPGFVFVRAGTHRGRDYKAFTVRGSVFEYALVNDSPEVIGE